eukprot:TRINITY_DN18320_c0_g1_i1.p1 TRINITY_DN18320_c0_g1~~TRINITY_DN18320_c0_g1_i1.p1  ORF type:complete len:276 (+),score=36.15 TRINITY_DN18320_c0_g1_i1:46-873(+)
MTTFDEEDEAAMDSILVEHQPSPLKRESSWDSPAMVPSGDPKDRPKAKEMPNINSFDCDSESGEDETGPIRAVLPDGKELYFSSFSNAAMSRKVMDCSTIHLPDGVHSWPGGDMRHSISGTGPSCVIQGNEGCGYFFYLRKSNISITGVTLRGTRNGRAHLYIDGINNICVSNLYLEGTYSQCIQILGSNHVSVMGCEFRDAIGPSVRISDSTNVHITNNMFSGTCSTTPLIVVGNSDKVVVADNKLSSKRVCVFDIRDNGCQSLTTDNNTVDFG